MEPYFHPHDYNDVTGGRSGLCPHCHKETGWTACRYTSARGFPSPIVAYTCQICNKSFYDYFEETTTDEGYCSYSLYRIWPMATPTGIEQPNPDMPDACKEIYNEAALVFAYSRRAAAALLRLCLQKLLTEAGISGNSIDKQIQNLIKSGEDPSNVLYMDICRILGNESVHPGTINLNEDTDTAAVLFMFINMATSRLFTAKRQINEIYQKLPSGVRKALEDRNARLSAETTKSE